MNKIFVNWQITLLYQLEHFEPVRRFQCSVYQTSELPEYLTNSLDPCYQGIIYSAVAIFGKTNINFPVSLNHKSRHKGGTHEIPNEQIPRIFACMRIDPSDEHTYELIRAHTVYRSLCQHSYIKLQSYRFSIDYRPRPYPIL